MATIDQSDIRGSEPHNHDPSGAASDRYRESGRACRIAKRGFSFVLALFWFSPRALKLGSAR
jgi:hypothetical protein